jgi:hypothetical protein
LELFRKILVSLRGVLIGEETKEIGFIYGIWLQLFPHFSIFVKFELRC